MAKHIPQFLTPDIDLTDSVSIEDFHVINHLRVLRRGNGDSLYLANGNGSKRLYDMVSMDKKSIICKAAKGIEAKPDVRNIVLIQAMTEKSSLEEILAKSTELGVREIVLFYSEYSQRFPLNKDKIMSEVVAAFEQSHGYYLPIITYRANIDEVLAGRRDIVVADTVEATQITVNTIEAGFDIAVMVGPEGGWSDAEREKLARYPHILLSDNVLRATTAATVAIGVVGYLSQGK